ncbi:DUF1416 domain-containing protein [Natronoglycomyces albus]|uniref:DUF1416 domain-containing protein n=1 Tax=Natronoglycomyces albus TaxID=2811108 RepID=A0A895XGX4_9ACTN|nr:DUF1416 domain-containing protein [Natronoglycomyces albus]QSB05101.1 DUF1416 domain-containing protein [Natronoglycomyces albus]
MSAATATPVNTQTSGCGAPSQDAALPAAVDLETETVVTGLVYDSDGNTVAGAYVRLLDGTGEFTAEVVTGAEGRYRFFAAPGNWTLRALSRFGDGKSEVTVSQGLNESTVTVDRS